MKIDKVYCPFCRVVHSCAIRNVKGYNKINNQIIKHCKKMYHCMISNKYFENDDLYEDNLCDAQDLYELKMYRINRKPSKTFLDDCDYMERLDESDF